MKKDDIRKDLRALSGLLSGWGKFVKNPNILQSIGVIDNSNNNDLKYSILTSEPLTFSRIDLDRHCLPVGIEKLPNSDIDVEVNLSLFCCESKKDDYKQDPIKSLGVNITVNAFYNNGEDIKEANCSWHLDKGSPENALFSHPEYHMNFGGSHMVKQGDIFGNLLLLSSPRILHPPMDIILSCDFIIRNFYTKSNHQKITLHPKYLEIVENAKSRYWQPYSKAFSSKWNNDHKIDNLPYINLVGHH
ncbi:hypothetical protein [Flavobacterium sp.]|uniref:hypothetical protein n=1 Tax=Flavobacterium sp. TaxID=239 RepID=UPI003D6BD536